MAKEKRFEKVYSQGAGSVEIWVDNDFDLSKRQDVTVVSTPNVPFGSKF